MLGWLLNRYKKYPRLTIAVGVYLALSAIDFARVVTFERPDTNDTGFYPWEAVATPANPEATIQFHWSSAEGAMLRPVEGSVLRLLFYDTRPDMLDALPVSIRIDDRLVDKITLSQRGWHTYAYYLPPILGAATWGTVERGWAERPGGNETASSTAMAGWQELRPWHRRPGPPSIWIDIAATSTFVPSRLLDVDDDRVLGIAVADVKWQRGLPSTGIGLYPWGSDATGAEFRWTGRWASLPLQTNGAEAVISVHAPHPDIEQSPVLVDFFWDATLKHTVELAGPEQVEVRVPVDVARGTQGVLSLRVDRTWNPVTTRMPANTREFGVGITRVEWR
jgi:hypothetical protein